VRNKVEERFGWSGKEGCHNNEQNSDPHLAIPCQPKPLARVSIIFFICFLIGCSPCTLARRLSVKLREIIVTSGGALGFSLEHWPDDRPLTSFDIVINRENTFESPSDRTSECV